MSAKPIPATLAFPALLASLEAAAETTRLRLLGLLCEAELTVSELVAILGQSQPRISRHLKLLVDAGMAERHREGAWAFFRLAEKNGALARDLIARIDAADPVLTADRARLQMTREARRRQAASWFAQHAADWDSIRALHASEERVEKAILEMIGPKPIGTLLDLGTGGGRMIELIAPQASRAIGIDQSPAMLGMARSHIESAGLRHVQLRQGDIYAAPVERDSCDLVIIHQVLHFLDDPQRAIREAASALRPGGRLLVVDFAAHGEEFLREDFAHRRLGFAVEEIEAFLAEAGLTDVRHELIAPAPGEPGKLTVVLWMAQDLRFISDALPRLAMENA